MEQLPFSEPVWKGDAMAVTKPITDDRAAWQHYWHMNAQPWRMEPEILPDRRAELIECQRRRVDSIQGQFRWQHVTLTRADIEWLLDAHNDMWQQVADADIADQPAKHAAPVELDVRGADLRKCDLSHLPLRGLSVGLTTPEWMRTSPLQQFAAVTHLEQANLAGADLTAACLNWAEMGAANLTAAKLTSVLLQGARLQGACLRDARLQGAMLHDAFLQRANLRNAQLTNVNLTNARLSGADLRGAICNEGTLLVGASLSDGVHGGVLLAGTDLTSVYLASVDWSNVPALGDEWLANDPVALAREQMTRDEALHQAAAAYRSVATQLHYQQVHRQATRFEQRARYCERATRPRLRPIF